MANKLAELLHNQCRLGFPNTSQPETKSEVAQQVGALATQRLPPGGFQTLRRGIAGDKGKVAHNGTD